jgi:hypothetical protein
MSPLVIRTLRLRRILSVLGAGVLVVLAGVAFGPSAAAASLPAGPYLLVGGGNGSMSLINRTTGTNAAQVMLGGTVGSVLAGPGNKAVFASYLNGIAVVDPTTLGVTTTIARPSHGTAPYFTLAMSADRTTIAAADRSGAIIDVFDATSATWVKSMQLPGLPGQGSPSLALSADGSTLYVAPDQSSVITVVDVATATVLGTVTLPNQVVDLALTTDGSSLYAQLQSADQTQGFVSVVDTATRTVSATWPMSVGFPTGIAVAATGPVYATSLTGTLNAFDPTFGTLVVNKALSAGSLADPVVTSNGSTVYVAVLAQQQVLAVSIPGLTVTTITTLYFQNILGLMDYTPPVNPGPGPSTTTTTTSRSTTTSTSPTSTASSTSTTSGTTSTPPETTTSTTTASASATSEPSTPSTSAPPTRAAAAPLSSTGTNAGAVAVAAGLLLLLGTILVLLARGRTRRA